MSREQFLQNRVTSLLRRLSAPKSIAGSKELIDEETSGIVRLIGAMMPRSGYEDWWSTFEANLLAEHQTRSWPTQYEIRKAAESMRKDVAPDQAFESHVITAMDFFDRHRKACPWFNSEAITNEFLRVGRLRNVEEARHYGFELSQEQRDRAKAMPMCREAWKRHVNITARLTGQTYSEAERQEFGAISEGRRPA